MISTLIISARRVLSFRYRQNDRHYSSMIWKDGQPVTNSPPSSPLIWMAFVAGSLGNTLRILELNRDLLGSIHFLEVNLSRFHHFWR